MTAGAAAVRPLASRGSVAIVLDGHLGLRVGTQVLELAGLELGAQCLDQLVGEADRSRHQLRSLVDTGGGPQSLDRLRVAREAHVADPEATVGSELHALHLGELFLRRKFMRNGPARRTRHKT